jgi:septal ring factor EnvC (AmiA/AmiB activator)
VRRRFGVAEHAGEAPANGAAASANGIEIDVPEGTPVRALHAGTVGFSGEFSGYGTLVILDHGGNQFSLYGYLGSMSVERERRVEAGQEIGRAGLAPTGPPGLYLELRVDGRSVDPLQWLQPR